MIRLAAIASALGVSRRTIERRALNEAWPCIEQKARGGTIRLYDPTNLPNDILGALKTAQITELLAQSAPALSVVVEQQPESKSTALAPVATPARNLGPLADWQRDTATARAVFVRSVLQIVVELQISERAAINSVVARAKAGTLPANMAEALVAANKKMGSSGRTISPRTLYNWLGDYKNALSASEKATTVTAVSALAPKARSMKAIPRWAEPLLREFQKPQKPSLSAAIDEILPDFPDLTKSQLEGRARRLFDLIGTVELQIGRIGPRELKALKPFIRRDRTVLYPGEMLTADGHCFDAEIAHPFHKKAFRPEISAFVDVRSGRLVGWSIDLAESGLAVLDALRAAVETAGIPAMLYVDNGPGYKNALMSKPGTGVSQRLGFEVIHSAPYSSQSRGIIERTWGSVFVRAAKELPTYIGKDMDKEARQKVFKLTRKDIKESGKSPILMDFEDFVIFINKHITEFNARPHRGLPKVTDPVTGKKRHLSPNEEWARGMAEKDAPQPIMLDANESRELFRPQISRKVQRGELNLFGNRYTTDELQEWNGKNVYVAYDINHPEEVWVYDLTGRYICNAEFEGNKRGYVPTSVRQKADQKRAKARAGRLEIKLEEVAAELAGRPLKAITDNPSPTLNNIMTIVANETVAAEQHAADAETVQQIENPNQRPMFANESDRYEWLRKHVAAWTEFDQRWLGNYVQSELYEQLADYWADRGLGWDESLIKKVSAA